MEVTGQLHASAALSPRKQPPVWTLWRRQKSCPWWESNRGCPSRRYTDWAMQTPCVHVSYLVHVLWSQSETLKTLRTTWNVASYRHVVFYYIYYFALRQHSLCYLSVLHRLCWRNPNCRVMSISSQCHPAAAHSPVRHKLTDFNFSGSQFGAKIFDHASFSLKKIPECNLKIGHNSLPFYIITYNHIS
jgi:hypothetical protein